MAELFDLEESVAAGEVPGLAEVLAQFAPELVGQREALKWAARLRIVDPQGTSRAELLGRLVFPDETPSPYVAERELLGRWIEPGDQAGLSELRRVEPDPGCPVLIASQMWSGGAIAADWGFFVDRLAAAGWLGWYTTVVPRDGRWVLATGLEEFVRVARPNFTRIRGLSFSMQTQVRPGLIVPKPQCRVEFDDGACWLSGRIHGVDGRSPAIALLRFLTARTGVPVNQVEFIREIDRLSQP